MAESVDASDLKSDRGSTSVPVQVWPGADKRHTMSMSFLLPDFHTQDYIRTTFSFRPAVYREILFSTKSPACGLASNHPGGFLGNPAQVWPGADKRHTMSMSFFIQKVLLYNYNYEYEGCKNLNSRR